MDTIIVERADGIVTVTLNQPRKKNAISFEMWDGLVEVFREVTQNPDDRAMQMAIA